MNSSEWKTSPIGDLINHKKGFAFKSTLFGKEIGRRVIRVSDTSENSIKDDEPIFMSEQNAQKYSDYELYPDDIILSTVGSRPPLYESMVGKAIRVPRRINGALLNQNLVKLSPKTSLVDPFFLYSHLKTKRFISYIEGCCRGNANQVSITLDDIFAFEIFLPPLPEQKKIAEILSCWDSAIEAIEKLIDARTRFKKGLMQRLFDESSHKNDSQWSFTKIGECCEILDNRRKPLNKSERQQMRGGIPYYGANGVVDHINDFLFDEDLILMAEDGGYFDEFSTRPIAYKVTGKSWVNNHAHVLRAKEGYSQDFIYYSLVHKNIVRYLNGGTRAKLNKGDLVDIRIPIPKNILTQNSIAEVMNCIDIELSQTEDLKSAFTVQKQGLMQQLLTGKIRVSTSKSSTESTQEEYALNASSSIC